MSPKPESAELRLRVTPRSSRPKVEIAESGEIKVWVTAPPVDGEANVAVIQTLAKALGIAKSRLEIVGGDTSRNKTVRVEGLSTEDALRKLAEA